MSVSDRTIESAVKEAMKGMSDPNNPLSETYKFSSLDVAMGWISACMELKKHGRISDREFNELLREAAIATSRFSAARKQNLI